MCDFEREREKEKKRNLFLRIELIKNKILFMCSFN